MDHRIDTAGHRRVPLSNMKTALFSLGRSYRDVTVACLVDAAGQLATLETVKKQPPVTHTHPAASNVNGVKTPPQ